MSRRFFRALLLAVPALIALSGPAEAAKSPDATEVGVGTFLVVVGVMTLLGVVALIRAAFGGMRLPPPEEPSASDHH